MRRYSLFHRELNEVIELGPVLVQNKYLAPSNREYEDHAWNLAVREGLVSEMDRGDYIFEYQESRKLRYIQHLDS
ncbi:MAG: hypothetical protein OQJ89_10885 [Kangiellaceae bacterium]|nr:hypothetical protein [Kangiellaceae bacterium]MCW8999037.1 hypothetical protein [Kangiellaceae bacterium]MCW9017462.1 hypothetical protein [Kangiellaceae bacterium]